MAQLVEQRIRNAWVRGSSPLIGFLCKWYAFRAYHIFYMEERTMAKPAVWKQMIKNKSFLSVTAFCVLTFALIMAGVFALHTPVVPMCALAMLEAGIAVMLHRAELWLHGVLILAQLLIAAFAGRLLTAVLCAAVYALATMALQVLGKDE